MRVSNKDKYINNAINRFSGNARDILLKQIELFYDVDNQVTKNRYNIGDDVKLKREHLFMVFLEN